MQVTGFLTNATRLHYDKRQIIDKIHLPDDCRTGL